MLDDRSSNVESVKAMGTELAAQAGETEKEQIEEQLADLTDRWESLTQTANARQQKLDTMITVSKAFHDVLEPFLEWLDSTEKKAANLDTISSDPDKIEKQLDEYRVRGSTDLLSLYIVL